MHPARRAKTCIFHSSLHPSDMPSLSTTGAQPCHSPGQQLLLSQRRETEVAQGGPRLSSQSSSWTGFLEEPARKSHENRLS